MKDPREITAFEIPTPHDLVKAADTLLIQADLHKEPFATHLRHAAMILNSDARRACQEALLIDQGEVLAS